MNIHLAGIAPLLIGGALLAGLAIESRAQPPPTTKTETSGALGQMHVARTTKATALVVGIDTPRRIIELRLHGGHVVDMVAGPDVRNFEQISIGDRVDVQYSQALSLELKKNGSGIRGSTARADTTRSPLGAKPEGTVRAEVTVLADVVSVNRKTHVVTLRGPKGNLIELTMEDPTQLQNVKAGDQVEAVYSEAVALTVDLAPRAKK